MFGSERLRCQANLIAIAVGVLLSVPLGLARGEFQEDSGALLARLDRALMDPGSQRTLPKDVVAVLGSNFGRHGNCAKCVALSPDGRSVASGSRDEAVRIWDAETMELVRAYPHPEDVDDVWFSSDGRFLHSASWDGYLRTFELASERLDPVFSLQIDDGQFSSVAFEKGDKLFASNSKFRAEQGLNPAILEFAWDGTRWEKTGFVLVGFADLRFPAGDIACSEDGKRVATQSMKRSSSRFGASITLWTREDQGVQRQTIRVSEDLEGPLWFDPRGEYLLAILRDGTIRSIALADGAEKPLIDAERGKARSLCFSRDGKQLYVGTYEGGIHEWDWMEGKAQWRASLAAHGGWVSEIVFSNDAQCMFSSGWDHTVRRSTRRGEQWVSADLIGHDHPVNALAFSNNGRWIATGATTEVGMRSHPNDVLVWELGGAQPVLKHRLKGAMGYIESLAFSRDNRILAAACERQILAWDTATFEVTNQFSRTYVEDSRTRDLNPESLVFVGDGHRLLSGWNEGMVLLVDIGVKPAKELDAWKSPFHYVESIDISRDGAVGFVSSIPISIEGDRLHVARNQELNESEKNAQDPKPERVGIFDVYRPIKALYERVAINDDGTKFVGASRQGAISSYDFSQPNAIEKVDVQGHATVIDGLDIRDDGTIASGDWSGIVRLWNFGKGRDPIKEWELGRVWSLRFSPDGLYLAVGSGSGLVYLVSLAEMEVP